MRVMPGTKWSVMLLLICFFRPAALLQAQYSQPEYDPPEPTGATTSVARFTGTVTLSTGPKANDKDYARARGMIRAGQVAEGCALLEKLIEANPAYMKAWNLLGSTYWRNDQQDDAIRLWKNLNAIAPAELFGHNALGDAYRTRNELERALEEYRASLQIDPNQTDVSLQMGRVLRWSGQLDKAIATLLPLLESHPGRDDIKSELARAYQSSRQFNRALPLWNELLATDPDNPDVLARQTIAMFYAGDPADALMQADYVASQNPTNSEILSLLADAQEFNGYLVHAVPHLNKLYDMEEAQPAKKRRVLNRLISLYNRAYDQYPESLSLNDLCDRIREQIELEPKNPDLYLALADIHVMMGDIDEAASGYQEVLDTLNPWNIRGHRGLFEVAMSRNDFGAAKKEIAAIREFNPRDPYLHYIQARLAADESRYRETFQELDELEEQGFRGAVVVMLYHGLSISDTSDLMPVSVFREHMESLRAAGYRFITAAEIPSYFEQYARKRELLGVTNIERVVCITFDDARRDAMRIGTPAAKDLDLVLSMHVPAGYAVNQHPFLCTWDMLKDFENSGSWIMGGHLYMAHEREPIDADGNLCYPLANRIWLKEAGRLETTNEYVARLAFEYRESQTLIEENLKTASACPFVAYPFGDVGQQTLCNVSNAVALNLAECAKYYKLGFIQSPFGYALYDDNPLLYQRTEGERWETGSHLVERLLKNHPVLLARRMRAEFASVAGKKFMARDALYSLQEGGYPPSLLEKTWQYVERRLGRRIPENSDFAPKPAEKAPTPAVPSKPDSNPAPRKTPFSAPLLRPPADPAPSSPAEPLPESEPESGATPNAAPKPRLDLLRDPFGTAR